jgi:hypothetical protein
MTTNSSTTIFGLVLLLGLALAGAFQMSTGTSANRYRTVLMDSKLFGPEEYDDGIGNTNNNGKSDQDGGQALAKDFYEQLRKRGQDELDDDVSLGMEENRENSQIDKLDKLKITDEEARSLNREPFTRRQEMSSSTTGTTPTKKFTGRQDSFYRQPSSSSSLPSSQVKSPREAMMEREYQLVENAERGIFAQAAFAVLALAFYIFVGLNGGIVTGDAALNDDFGGDDEIPFETLMPVQRDSETSVWL